MILMDLKSNGESGEKIRGQQGTRSAR